MIDIGFILIVEEAEAMCGFDRAKGLLVNSTYNHDLSHNVNCFVYQLLSPLFSMVCSPGS